MNEQCDVLVFMNAPSPYWVDFAKYLRKYYKINFIFYSTCSALGRPAYWDVELPNNCSIVSDGVVRWGSYFYDDRVVTRIKDLNPRVVISQGVNLLSARKALNYCNKKNIHFSIWNEIWRDKKGTPRKNLSRIYAYAFKRANSRFSASIEGKRFWRDLYKQDTLLYQVPGNIDQYLSHKKNHDSNFLTLLFGHRLIEQYNPVGAVEVASIIAKSRPVKLFMNASGHLRATIDSLIAQKNIDFLEFIDVTSLSDLGGYYEASHFSISPCFYSQGNIGTNEALASGCPIIISDNVRYHDRQIEEADVGCILPLNYDLFAEKIIEIYDNKSLYLEMSQNSKVLVKNTLSNSVLLKYYDECVFCHMGVGRK